MKSMYSTPTNEENPLFKYIKETDPTSKDLKTHKSKLAEKVIYHLKDPDHLNKEKNQGYRPLYFSEKSRKKGVKIYPKKISRR